MIMAATSMMVRILLQVFVAAQVPVFSANR